MASFFSSLFSLFFSVFIRCILSFPNAFFFFEFFSPLSTVIFWREKKPFTQIHKKKIVANWFFFFFRFNVETINLSTFDNCAMFRNAVKMHPMILYLWKTKPLLPWQLHALCIRLLRSLNCGMLGLWKYDF